MTALVLRCVFVAHSYQGVRLTQDQREELDWPPSPARLHQALMAAALTSGPFNNDSQSAANALEALRWLEQQDSPEIVATAIEEAEFGTRFRLAIPQNNPAKSDLTKTSMLLAASLRRRVGREGGALAVEYIWRLEAVAAHEAAMKHLEALADLTAQIRYLGRAEDQIEAQIGMKEHPFVNTTAVTCETWHPSSRAVDVDLWVPKNGTTDDLVHNHARIVPARTRKPPASRYLRAQGYAREAVEGLLPVHVAIFQFFTEAAILDEPPLSSDAENAGIWRSRIRQRAVDFALEARRWDNPDLAVELITGHPPGQPKRTDQPHLAIVPVPSISIHGKADGRVRRFALLGYAKTGIAADAAEVYRVLCASLDGEMIEAAKSRYRLQRLAGRPEADKVWSQYVRASRVWHSVTPVALARGFKVPAHSQDGSRRLTSDERYLRKLAEWEALFRASLSHVSLPEDHVAACAITLTPSPLVPNTQRAERYRPPGESAVFTHARIEFSARVRGPLIVGDRRYQGYGLFCPY